MEKFKDFTENLMKVILVPDETSDSVGEVTPQPEAPDVFTQTASDFKYSIDGDDAPCGCVTDDSVDDSEDMEDDADFTVTNDTTGLKISMNGMDFTFPNEVVEKIKDVLTPDGEGDYEESDETPDQDNEED